MKGFLLGLILGLLAIPLFVYLYFTLGTPPVAVADAPFPIEKQIVDVPLDARIHKEMPKTAPIEPSATNLEAGAHIYRQQCASCHGLYGRPSDFASHMYPQAPQLWAPHRNGVVGVSDACIATNPSDMAVAMRALDATVWSSPTTPPRRR